MDLPESSHNSDKKRYFCGHCKMNLCKTMFYAHKKLYFDKHRNAWNPKLRRDTKEGADFVFDDDSSEGI